MESLGLFGGEGDGLDGALDFAAAFGDDLALFAGDGFGQIVGAFTHEFGGTHEDRVAAVGGQLAHHGGATDGAGDGGFHIGGVAAGNGVEGALVEGIDDGHLGIAVDPLAADVHLHGGDSLRWLGVVSGEGRKGLVTSGQRCVAEIVLR